MSLEQSIKLNETKLHQRSNELNTNRHARFVADLHERFSASKRETSMEERARRGAKKEPLSLRKKAGLPGTFKQHNGYGSANSSLTQSAGNNASA